jgi:hypothetical protein
MDKEHGLMNMYNNSSIFEAPFLQMMSVFFGEKNMLL